ncbi:MAG: pirin family protein [Gemmatimonadetes bacterium]|jgi:quercetin 2,3-dioxygenase|nr:pirin family protein [Gemmatimonadota bacterium]
MITLRRDRERHYLRSRKQKVWFTFNSQDRTGPLANGFGTLELLDEYRLLPSADVPHHPHHDAEIVTYVRQGALAYEDSMGHSGVVRAGEFQRTTAGRGLHLRQTNASGTDWAHVFQIWLRPSEAELEPYHEQRRFSAAERRGVLCIIASPDARRDSLLIHQDVLMYSALLDPGQHVVHPLLQGHRAWLHLVEGEVTLDDAILATGDGAGIQAERAVSLTAREKTEILLLDLGDQELKRQR